MAKQKFFEKNTKFVLTRSDCGDIVTMLLRESTYYLFEKSQQIQHFDNLTAYATLKIFEDYSEQNLKAVNG